MRFPYLWTDPVCACFKNAVFGESGKNLNRTLRNGDVRGNQGNPSNGNDEETVGPYTFLQMIHERRIQQNDKEQSKIQYLWFPNARRGIRLIDWKYVLYFLIRYLISEAAGGN